jgi:glutamyl-tRNA reductase
MKLACLGCNWKTPVAIRERLAIDAKRLPEALARLKELTPGSEAAILSTCNRTEVYLGTADDAADFGIEKPAEFLAHFQGMALPELHPYLYFHEDAGTALHLFRVAAGLDSLVLGEVQILGQAKDAYKAAVAAETAGPLLHPLFQKAFSVAKRVQTETELAKGKLSIAGAAIDFIEGVFDDFADKTVLVIGAGKMAELTLAHLAHSKPRRIVVCNRSEERGAALAAQYGGTARGFDALTQCMIEADVVVSGTGADETIVKAVDFAPVAKARRGRHMAIIDIAVPRDFDPAIGEFENVFLWNIDHLERVRKQTLRQREKALDQAIKIVDAEVSGFLAALALQQTGPILAKLDEQLQQIADKELEWLLPQLNGIPEADRAKIRQFAHRLKNKFLHPPRTALRAEANAGNHNRLLEALRKLFGV